MTDPDDKKDRVLHTRVPESLESELKQRAKALGISMSNLVRNILVHSAGLVGDIVVDGANIGRAARGEPLETGYADTVAPPAARRILGWQEIILNLNAVCDQCNNILPKGSRAGASVSDSPGPKSLICERCLKEIRRGTDSTSSDDTSR